MRIAHLFVMCMTPLNPLTSRVPMAVRAPGKVSAMMVGSIVCMVKKTGKVAVWRVANCGRGSDLKAITPPMKDLQGCQSSSSDDGCAFHKYLKDGRSKKGSV